MNLIERAKTISKRQDVRPSREELELAVAWLHSEVGIAGVGLALGLRGGNAYNRLAIALREAYHKGLLKDGD
jgi:hypothetical protein